MRKNEVFKTIKISKDIVYLKNDNTRCSYSCFQLEKEQGIFTCTLFRKVVDEGFDENGYYLFKRCPLCLEATNDKE